MELSAEQREVVELCERGQSVFFTGSAGTGKSVCLRYIIKRLREKYGESVFVTASTGMPRWPLCHSVDPFVRDCRD